MLAAQGDEVGERHRLGEAGDAIVAGVDLHQSCGVRADGFFEVAEARDVGGADLLQDGAADGHDVGDAEAAADFDELAARDDHFLAVAQSAEGDDRGGGVVVDGGRGFGPGEAADPLADGRLS